MGLFAKISLAAIGLSVFLSIGGGIASANSIGVDFKNMPVGTQIHYINHNGYEWIEVFVGKKKNQYVLKRTAKGGGKKVLARTYFDLQGREVARKGKSDGRKTKFQPYNCWYATGQCSHVLAKSVSNSGAGGHKENWIFQNSFKGSTLKVVRKRQSSEVFNRPTYVTFGKFNIIMRQETPSGGGGKAFLKVTKIVVP